VDRGLADEDVEAIKKCILTPNHALSLPENKEVKENKQNNSSSSSNSEPLGKAELKNDALNLVTVVPLRTLNLSGGEVSGGVGRKTIINQFFGFVFNVRA
jgi:hypothetical protein